MPQQYDLTQDDVAFMRALALNTNTVALPRRIFAKDFAGSAPDAFSQNSETQALDDEA